MNQSMNVYELPQYDFNRKHSTSCVTGLVTKSGLAIFKKFKAIFHSKESYSNSIGKTQSSREKKPSNPVAKHG
jgi:hypothetical protein